MLLRALLGAAIPTLGTISLLAAQEDPAPSGRQEGNPPKCDLSYESRSPETESFHVEEPTGGYTTYIRRGMIWRCGTATMKADSAVRYESARYVELVRQVDYRDTIRTLRSDRLIYDQARDEIDAIGNVHLTRLASGSSLTGPRVRFLRAVSGQDEITRATGRPHMTLYPRGESDAPPFEVDADESVFAGEEEARAIGNVTIRRPDMQAGADSAHFDLEGGGGVLYGSPWVHGETFRLTADTIYIGFEEGELREVRAIGTGTATGEDFEVLAERITVEVEGEEVSAVWAHGPGRSLAISSSHRLYGDSLRFLMFEGEIDTVIAVGDASAVQITPEPSAAPDSPSAEEAELPEAGVADSVTAEVALPLSEEAPVETVEQEASEAEEAGEAAAAEAEAEEGRVPPPDLTTGEHTSWVRGDTLFAAFARRDSTAGAPSDSAKTSQVEWIRTIGHARSYYSATRDTARTGRRSRNYVLARALEIVFEGGEPRRVSGEDAIGVYLEPAEVVADAADSGSSADTLQADSTRADSARADSTRAGSTRADPGRAARRTRERRCEERVD